MFLLGYINDAVSDGDSANEPMLLIPQQFHTHKFRFYKSTPRGISFNITQAKNCLSAVSSCDFRIRS